MLNVCLFEPEIPQNTGNIARTCAATGARLHLVHPLGFEISDKTVKRAGLDYWKDVEIIEYKSIADFLEQHKADELWFFSQRGKYCFTDIKFNSSREIYLIFGKESVGLDEALLIKEREHSLRIPIKEGARCLNLSNSVAIAVYEVERQNLFKGLKTIGSLYKSEGE